MALKWVWHNNWADVAAVPGASESWAHHGLAVTGIDEIVGVHAGQVVRFSRDGTLSFVGKKVLSEGHQITLVRDETGVEFLWIADPGFCMSPMLDGSWGITVHGSNDVKTLHDALSTGFAHSPRVVVTTLDGDIVQQLDTPPGVAFYAPTSVAVNEVRYGGTGDVWVADGYGSSQLHRFDASGAHIATMDGPEDGSRFSCPHAVFIDRRKAYPELYVADRNNQRLVVFDMDGNFSRTIEGVCNSPSSFAVRGDWMLIAELNARLAVLDVRDQLVGYVGENGDVCRVKGWPNAVDAHDRVSRSADLVDNRFHSPHGVCVDSAGNIYVAEWLIGGRYTKLVPQ